MCYKGLSVGVLLALHVEGNSTHGDVSMRASRSETYKAAVHKDNTRSVLTLRMHEVEHEENKVGWRGHAFIGKVYVECNEGIASNEDDAFRSLIDRLNNRGMCVGPCQRVS